MKSFCILRSIVAFTVFLEAYCDDYLFIDTNSSSSEDSVRLLYGETHTIAWTDIAVSERMPLLVSHPYMKVTGVDYHYSRNLLFFTAWGYVWRKPLRPMHKTQEALESKVLSLEVEAEALAVDWVHDRLYCTSTKGQVWSSDLEGTEESRRVVVEGVAFLEHNNLVLDPYSRYLFLTTDLGHTLRTGLEGEDPVKINHRLSLVTAALDRHNCRLIISGFRDFVPVLVSSNYDGSGVTTFDIDRGTDSDGWVILRSIDVFSGSSGRPPVLFWVHHDWKVRDTVWKVNMSDDGELYWQKEYIVSGSLLHNSDNKLWCLKVYHPDVQTRPKHENATFDFSGGSTSFTTKTSLLYLSICLILYNIARL